MQIEHDDNGPVKGNLKAQRVHRVFHRIGVVLGLPILAMGIFLLLASGYQSITGFIPAKTVTDIVSYSYPVTQNGDLVVYRDGSSQSVSSYIAQENGVRGSQHQAAVNKYLAFGILLSFGSVALYAVSRAFGWVIAGAF